MYIKEKDGRFYGVVEKQLVMSNSTLLFREYCETNNETIFISYENGKIHACGGDVHKSHVNGITANSVREFLTKIMGCNKLYKKYAQDWVALEDKLCPEPKVTTIPHCVVGNTPLTGRSVSVCPLWDEVAPVPQEGSTAYPITDGFVHESDYTPHVYWKSREGFVALAKMSKTHIRAAIAFLEKYEDQAYDEQKEKLASRWISLFKNELKRREEGRL